MTINQLLAMLADRKITLRLEGGRLKYRAPTGALTPDLREAVSQHRPKIIDRLATTRNGKAHGEHACVHIFSQDWVDQPLGDGRIRSTCRLCGRFIGYRPEDC